MPDFRYLDIDIDIDRVGSTYHVQVTNSPAGTGDADFTLPFNDIELENFLLKLGGARRRVRRIDAPEMDAAKQFGGRLFGAVFSGTVRDCLTGSLARADASDAGLRVRLHLDGAPELADLPWEFLYNPSLNRFLALSVDTPLVRFIDVPERIRPLDVTPPLRILAVIANASDYEPLDVEREWKHLREALQDAQQSGRVTLERLEVASLPALQKKLQEREYHILHFVGHGGFDERAQDGELIMEEPSGRGRRVGGQYLGTILHDHASMRLVVLNACEGARSSRTDPFAGVAQSLVQQGVPAVIAMQFEISDDAATVFAGGFYEALARGYPVDAALAEVRKTLYAGDNAVEWGTPVLYLRAPDGKIFDVHGAAVPGAPAVPPARIERAAPLPAIPRDLVRKPLVWIVALGAVALLIALGVFVWNAIPRGISNSDVSLGELTTASQVVSGPVAGTYIPVGRRSSFKPQDPELFVVVEMKRLPQSALLELRVRQTNGFDKIYSSEPRTRDIHDEDDAWWFFRIVPQELCAEPGADCPGSFEAEVLVNRASTELVASFTVLADATAVAQATASPPPPTPAITTAPTASHTPVPVATHTPAPVNTHTPAPAVTHTPTLANGCAFPVPDWIASTLEARTLGSLGCPAQGVIEVQAAEQLFEFGRIVQIQDFSVIYVIVSSRSNTGAWRRFPDTWKVGDPATGNLEPPAGLLEPKYGIGKVWLRELGGPKSSIGWAKTEATDVRVWRDQLFHNGFVLETQTHLYLFFNDQTFQAVQK